MHEVFDEFKRQLPDIDPSETDEWVESLDALVKQAGPERARFVLYKLLKRARMLQVGLPPLTQTRYINTISPEQEPDFPGDEEMEHRIPQFIGVRGSWSIRANTLDGIGGKSPHAASATVRVRLPLPAEGPHDGARLYQWHASPACRRSSLRRVKESQSSVRRGRNGRGLPLIRTAAHQTLESRPFPGTRAVTATPGSVQPLSPEPRHKDTSVSAVGLSATRIDEPESLGALHLAAREV